MSKKTKPNSAGEALVNFEKINFEFEDVNLGDFALSALKEKQDFKFDLNNSLHASPNQRELVLVLKMYIGLQTETQ